MPIAKVNHRQQEILAQYHGPVGSEAGNQTPASCLLVYVQKVETTERKMAVVVWEETEGQEWHREQQIPRDMRAGPPRSLIPAPPNLLPV